MQFNAGFSAYGTCNSGPQKMMRAFNKGFKLSAHLIVLVVQYYKLHGEAI